MSVDQADLTDNTVPAGAQGPRWTYTRHGYALAQSLRQLKHYKIASVGTLLALGITLCLPAILFFGYPALATLNERSVQGESLTAYLDTSVSDLDGAAMAIDWQSRSDIDSTRFISRDQALAMLAEETDIRDAMEVLGVNPLPGAVVVYPANNANTDQFQALGDELATLPAVTRVQLDVRWVKRLEAAMKLLQWIGGLMALFLTLTALLVIMNTIRLELSRRRAEMEVADLLGAPASFMNRPILYTGALYGFLGGLISCTIALITLNAIRLPADELASLYSSSFSLAMPEPKQIFIVLGISMALGLISALANLYRPSRRLTQ